MSYKEEMLELCGVRKALLPHGYYVCGVVKQLGGGNITISAVPYLPERHDAYIRQDEEVLSALPDSANFYDFGKARREAWLAGEETETL
jgi:hypothetical protein